MGVEGNSAEKQQKPDIHRADMYVRSHRILQLVNGVEFYRDFWEALVGEDVGNFVWQKEKGVYTRTQQTDPEYCTDRYGTGDDLDPRSVASKTVLAYADLAILPDDAVLSIGVAKDPICEACVIGNHCIQESDYQTEKDNADLLLLWIKDNNKNLKEGEDYLLVKQRVSLRSAYGELEEKEVDQLHIRVRVLREAKKHIPQKNLVPIKRSL